MPSNHLIFCHPLLLLTSIFPSIGVFSNELALCIKWTKYRSFSFSISPSNEYSGLISFRIDWFVLLLSKGLARVFSGTTVQKHQFFSAPPSFTETVPTAFAESGCELKRVRFVEHLHLYSCPPIPATDFTAPLDNYVIAALHRPLYWPC